MYLRWLHISFKEIYVRLNLRASLVAQMVKNPLAMQETWVQSLGQGDPLEKGMETHSSILAWRIPWTKEPGRLPWGHKELDMTEQLILLLIIIQPKFEDYYLRSSQFHPCIVISHMIGGKFFNFLLLTQIIQS